MVFLQTNLVIYKLDLAICQNGVPAVPDFHMCLRKSPLGQWLVTHILGVSNSFWPEVRQLFSCVYFIEVVAYHG